MSMHWAPPLPSPHRATAIKTPTQLAAGICTQCRPAVLVDNVGLLNWVNWQPGLTGSLERRGQPFGTKQRNKTDLSDQLTNASKNQSSRKSSDAVASNDL
ncbi:hypothetical protein J6590_027959 [Homalodisca vitripennis]|nr:hypothetical protein J6590_027959 [Homalodisca vitripennis]